MTIFRRPQQGYYSAMAKTLIVIVSVATLLTAVLVIYLHLPNRGQYGKKYPATAPPAPGAGIEVSSREGVAIPDSMKNCQVDNDCMWVFTQCGDCGGVASINKQHESKYRQQFANKCRLYKGPQCDTVFNGNVKCLAGQCAAVQ